MSNQIHHWVIPPLITELKSRVKGANKWILLKPAENALFDLRLTIFKRSSKGGSNY